MTTPPSNRDHDGGDRCHTQYGLPRKCSEEAINVRNIPAQKHRVNERENPWRNFTSSDRTDRRHQTRPYRH